MRAGILPLLLSRSRYQLCSTPLLAPIDYLVVVVVPDFGLDVVFFGQSTKEVAVAAPLSVAASSVPRSFSSIADLLFCIVKRAQGYTKGKAKEKKKLAKLF